MKENKNIDKIFQEKLKNFEKRPPAQNWEEISRRLDAGKASIAKKQVFPLWLKWSAAGILLLAIATGVWKINVNPPNVIEPEIVYENEEPATEVGDKVNQNPTLDEKLVRGASGNNNGRSHAVDTTQPFQDTIPAVQPKSSHNIASHQRERSITNTPYSKKAALNKADSNNHADYVQRGEIVGNNIDKASKNSYSKNSALATNEDGIVETHFQKETRVIESISQQFNDIIKTKDFDLPISTSLLEDTNKNELLVLLATKLSKEDEELEQEEKNDQRNLRLSTFAAPVFYANLGNGNELSNQFAGNTTSTEVTLSYGLKVAYGIADKLKIRTGVSKIQMNQTIANVAYSPTAINPGFNNIDSAEDHLEIRVDSPGESGLPTSNGNNNSSAAGNASPGIFSPGKLNQQFGFIEIPVEVEYALLDKRFGLHVIGGASGLFLDENTIDLVAGESRTNIGTANNINQTSFSTNLGFGVDYELNNKISLSVEPIIKYQLNTFTNVDDVNPVNFGVYSGINYRF